MWLLEFVKEKEGFRKEAYQDIVGVWTIGYGSTLGVKKGDTITKEDAESLLKQELNDFLEYVVRYGEKHDYNWNKNQIGALTSFCFNLGKSRLKQVTENGSRDNDTIATKMRLYHKARVNGELKPVKGLEIRRNEEADHFSS